jgi:hypothetical protein
VASLEAIRGIVQGCSSLLLHMGPAGGICEAPLRTPACPPPLEGALLAAGGLVGVGAAGQLPCAFVSPFARQATLPGGGGAADAGRQPATGALRQQARAGSGQQQAPDAAAQLVPAGPATKRPRR